MLVANLAWTTLCLGGYRAETMVVTSSLTGALVVLHLFARARVHRVDGQSFHAMGVHPVGWLLLPFLLYASINVVCVTPVPWLGWRDWLGWAQPVAVFWVVLDGLRSRQSHLVLWVTLFGLAIVAVFLAVYQRFGDHAWLMLGRTQSPYFGGRASGSFGIPNSLAGFLILLIPVALAATFRAGATAIQRVGFGYLAALLGFGLVLTISRGAWLALALALAAWPLVGIRGSRTRRLIWAVTITLLLAVAAFILFTQVPEVRDRLMQLKANAGERSRPIMWRAAVEIFREHPGWGGGAGSFNVRFDQHRREDFQDEPVWAHNDYLNTLSDYGVVGFGLFFGAVVLIAVLTMRAKETSANAAARANERWWIAPSVVGLMAFALQLFVEFHLKIPALALIVATIAAMVIQTVWTNAPRTSPASKLVKAVSAGLAVLVAAVTLGIVVPIYRAEALRQGARQSIDRSTALGTMDANAWQRTVDAALRDLTQAVEIDGHNGAAWADLSYALSLSVPFQPGRAAELGRDAQRAADRALACSSAPAEFWIRRGVARDLQGFRVEAGADYVTALQRAPTKGLVWYYHAVHMSLDANNNALALASLRFSLRLDPGNRQAQALLKRLADGSRASTSSSHAPD